MVEPWLVAGVFLVAVCYSMVGHGGASGYLALLAFTSISAEVRSTTALMLNVAVAGITFFLFQRAKHLEWGLAWPFLVGSIPLAFIGGRLRMESRIQSGILALVLLYASFALLFPLKPSDSEPSPPKRTLSMGVGAGVGVLSGLIGVGGGIFLSPLMILANWARPHQVAAISAGFIFANSIAGLLARPTALWTQGLQLWPLVASGSLGAIAGSYMGARKVSGKGLRQLLAVVLLVAVWKLVTKLHSI